MNYQRSELWFEDGNVILESEGIIYRVYRGILAHHSSIFSDMFSVPQGTQNLDLFEDGMPIVHMPDRSLDLLNFLKAIHTK